MRKQLRSTVGVLTCGLLLVVGCTTHPSSVTSLHVRDVPVPVLRAPTYDTQGTYPQVSSTGVDVTAVNRALREDVTADQAAYRPLALAELKDNPPQPELRGTYELDSDPTLVVANSVLVSTMYDSLELFPGGNDGGGWISTTVLVPSGERVTLAELFPAGSDWLRTVAALTRAEVIRTGLCAPSESIGQQGFDAGLAPKAVNYTHFALTPDGLDIGLGQGQIGAEACGARRVTISWDTLQGRLSALGARLAKASTQGLSTAPCSLLRLNAAFAHRPPRLQNPRISETDMAVQVADCTPGWALVTLEPPPTSPDEGQEIALFTSQGLDWREVDVLAADARYPTGDGLARCDLTTRGAPTAVAVRLLPSAPVHRSDHSC